MTAAVTATSAHAEHAGRHSNEVHQWWVIRARQGRPRVVNVGTVVDTYHIFSSRGIVDAVDDPVGAAPGRVVAGQLMSERLGDAVRLVEQRSGDELCHR